MENWKENRRLAAIVLVVAVLLGVFGIGGMKARGVARDLQDDYADIIAGDLALRAAAAQSIVEVGASALGENAPSVEAARKALEMLEAADGPAGACRANAELTASIGMLYEETRKVIGDEKGSVLQTQWSEFLSPRTMNRRAPRRKSSPAFRRRLSPPWRARGQNNFPHKGIHFFHSVPVCRRQNFKKQISAFGRGISPRQCKFWWAYPPGNTKPNWDSI